MSLFLILRLKYLCTLDSGIVVAPGIIVAPSYENFYIMILLLFYINLGIAVIFQFFFLRNFSKINNSRATTIQEVRVHTLSQIEIYPASKETIVKPGILRKAFWVFKM